jgi:predicted ferric reductase/Ca2+-binding EF-hand superfamily protein
LAAERDIESKRGTGLVSDIAELGRRTRTSDVVPKNLASDVAPKSAASELVPLPPSSDAPLVLDDALVALMHECFAELAGPDSRIDAVDFKRCLAVKSPFLAERVLAVFDRNRDGWVTRVEFLHGIPRLLFGSAHDKLKFAFRLHDLDGDGVIERAEIARMIELGLAEDGTAPDAAAVERFTALLVKAADANQDGCLSFSEFETIAAHHPDVLDILARAEQRWVTADHELPEADAAFSSRGARILRFFDNNAALVIVLSLWGLANAALFAHAWLKYEALGANHAIMVARGAGACLNFDGALVVLPLARRLVSWIRRTPLVRALPVDDGVAFHRLLGDTLFFFSLVHGAAHLVNYSRGPNGITASLFETSAGRTGLALLLVFAVLWAFSRRAVRASGRFELFYRTHLLYPVWFALALVHGPVFWIWAALPLAVFAVDRLVGLPQKSSDAKVLACVPLASGVTKLVVEKPAGFSHTAGDYVYMQLPALARHEWHPFTISSAPELPELTFHVRSLGDFTTALYRLAEERSRKNALAPLLAHLDGPFGTPSGRIFAAKRAVLIGAGIGVTPFASVLESIVLRAQAGAGSLENVRFYWLNRDAVSFEWFAKLLAELERKDTRKLVDIRIFMTGGRGDSTAMLLNLARDLAHALGDLDYFTGLRAKTEMGTPDWLAELGEAAGDDPGAVDVFFCGPPGLARSVKRVCAELDLRFHQEHF